jgi:hypothetical protein
MRKENIVQQEDRRDNSFIGQRKIWKTDVLGIGPFVINRDDADGEIVCSTRRYEDAQEIANIPAMIFALTETLNFFRESSSQLKLSEDDLLDLINGSLSYQEIE